MIHSPAYQPSIPKFCRLLAVIFLVALLQVACGGHGIPQTPVPLSQPTFSHVVLVVEENHSYSEVVSNSAMPYLNSLASQYGLATQYFANVHPSLPNYLVLTTGSTQTLDNSFSGAVSDDNVVRRLVQAGKTWKAYQESIPSAGYLGADTLPYVRHHNPFAYLSDIQQDASQMANIVPFAQFATDLADETLPQFSFISPNLENDGHDGSLAVADAWLRSNLAPLLANSTFQASGLLIITFDEGDDADLDHGGGHVATVIVSSKSKKAYRSQTAFQHQSTLRLVLAASGVDSFPGMAASAPDMTEFFNSQ